MSVVESWRHTLAQTELGSALLERTKRLSIDHKIAETFTTHYSRGFFSTTITISHPESSERFYPSRFADGTKIDLPLTGPVGYFHELTHVDRYNRDLDVSNPGDEESIVMSWENRFAKELGLPVRTSYFGHTVKPR